MKKSYILVLSLATLMIFAYATKWILSLKLAVIINALLILTNCVYNAIKIFRRSEK